MVLFDIVFISYQEPNAEDNWLDLVSRYPYAKRIHGVKGIHQAHRAAAKLATSSMFWVVDGDSTVLKDFNFIPPNDIWEDAAYVYRAINPVNNLLYGYGGIKLFPRVLALNVNVNSVDMTTSISEHFIPVPTVASVTNFNTDAFNSWKSAFRECVKLSSKVIGGQIDKDTEYRLEQWCSEGLDKPYGIECISGAIAGRVYGHKNAGNLEALNKINNFEWLQEQFNLA